MTYRYLPPAFGSVVPDLSDDREVVREVERVVERMLEAGWPTPEQYLGRVVQFAEATKRHWCASLGALAAFYLGSSVRSVDTLLHLGKLAASDLGAALELADFDLVISQGAPA